MAASFPAPALVQGVDEDFLLAIGGIVYPDFVSRREEENGLRLTVDGDPRDPDARRTATAMFQTLLGAVRAFRNETGELREEFLAGLGAGSVRDEADNQFIGVATVRTYTLFGGELEGFADNVRAAMDASQPLRNALWLNGRLNRTAADYYMIHEYAKKDLTHGEQGVRAALGVSVDAQNKLTQSANNLSPLEGGRHATEGGHAPWGLDDQRDFTADLLRRWIQYRSSNN